MFTHGSPLRAQRGLAPSSCPDGKGAVGGQGCGVLCGALPCGCLCPQEDAGMGDIGMLYQLRASGPGVPRDPTGATLCCTISHGFLSGTPVRQRCVEAAIAQCPSEE